MTVISSAASTQLGITDPQSMTKQLRGPDSTPLHSGTGHSKAGLPGLGVYAHPLHHSKPGAQAPRTSCHSRPSCSPKGGQSGRATAGQVPFRFYWSRGTKGRPIRDTAQARDATPFSLNTTRNVPLPLRRSKLNFNVCKHWMSLPQSRSPHPGVLAWW